MPEEEERCLANRPADMAETSQRVSASLIISFEPSKRKRWQRGSARELQRGLQAGEGGVDRSCSASSKVLTQLFVKVSAIGASAAVDPGW